MLLSHVEGDDERFLSVALQVAAHEARNGHGKIALELRDIVAGAKKPKPSARAVPIARGRRDSSGLLLATEPTARLSDLIASPALKAKLERVIREQCRLVKLKNHGLSPRRKLLLVGPPGTGKTFTASILASELGFPLFQVRFDALISKFMGESAAKLRQVFDAIDEVRGVYFFDEFDALGSQRASVNDVGEARRILNSFLQMLEQDQSNSVIICATNHVEMLDHALFRRFDDVVEYQMPGDDEIVTLFKSRLTPHVARGFLWKKLAELARGLSAAEITLVAQDAIKELLIQDYPKVTLAMLAAAVEERRAMGSYISR